MQRVLSQGALRRMATVRSVVMGLAACEPSLAVCSVIRPPHGQRWVSTSAQSKAVERPKPLPEEEPQPSPPHSQAGIHPVHGEDPTKVPGVPAQQEAAEVDPLQDKSITIVQRFRKTFKQYGKVLIPVHLLTSSLWFGTFYYAAMKGVNVVPFLEVIGLPEKLVGLLKDSQSGYAITAYAMFKIVTPARYTVTLGGTSLSVQYLRKHGYFSTPPPVKDYLQDKMEETREKFSEKMEETKERFSEKMEETKELFSERMEETKERISERMEETKERISERMEETKERLSGKMEETKELFSERMEETKERISERMGETKERISGKMEETKERLSGKMEETKDKLSEQLQETKDKVSFGKKTD